jgi:hypothetical protein
VEGADAHRSQCVNAIRKTLANGGWQKWLLGIVATLVTALVTNVIAFERETREKLTRQEEQLKHLEQRAENILTYLRQRIDERTSRAEGERELRHRDEAIARLDDRFHETAQFSFPGLSGKMLEFREPNMIRILEALV